MAEHQNRVLSYGDALPESFVDSIQELLASYASPNLKITLANPTTIQVVGADSGNGQVCLSIDGRFRINKATVQAAHPGGAAGTHAIYATAATDNTYVGATDTTNYTWALQILTSGTPSTTLWRQIGTLDWDGAAITRIRSSVSSEAVTAADFVRTTPVVAADATVQPSANVVALTVATTSGHTADRIQVKNAAAALIFAVEADGDVNIPVGNVSVGTGNVSVVGQVQGKAGTAGSPSLTFSGDPDTGVYSDVANTIKASVGGVLQATLDATALTLVPVLVVPAGTALLPSHTFAGDLNTGIYSDAADTVKVTAGGTLKLTVSATAVVGAVPFNAPDGDATLPGFVYASDTNTGFFRQGTDSIGVTAGGTERVRLGTATVALQGNVSLTALGYSAITQEAIGLQITGDTQRRLVVRADGRMVFGPGGSTAPSVNLQFADAVTLKLGTESGTTKSRLGLQRDTDWAMRYLEIDGNDNLLLSVV